MDQSSKVIRVGNIVLFVTQKKVFAADRTLKRLTPQELKLLQTFMEHPERVFTKEELLALAWGPNYKGNTNTVSTHLSFIRKKVEIDPNNPVHIIWTGEGFCFHNPS